jgi:hypothetical protein
MYSAVVEIDRALLEQRFRDMSDEELLANMRDEFENPRRLRRQRTGDRRGLRRREEQLGQSRQHHVAHRARGQGVATLLDEIRGART